MKSEKVDQLTIAMSKVQAEISAAKKDSENPFFKSKYADLSSVWEACRGPLTKNGLCVLQTTEKDGDGFYLVTTLMHISGQWISGKYPIITQKQDPQSIGSAITYARRYSLAAVVGVVADVDDDGESAMGRDEVPKPPQLKPLKSANKPAVAAGEHVITFGKFKGKKIADLDVYEIEHYVRYIVGEAEKNGKEIKNGVLAFVENAEAFLNSRDVSGGFV